MNLQEIKTFASMLDNLHRQRILEQMIDQTYYDDQFKVNITAPFHVVRTGAAARIVDNIVAHLQGAAPQVFREPKKSTATARDSAEKVGRMLNAWANSSSFLLELGEAFRNAVLRGDFWFQVDFNKDAYDKDTYAHKPNQMPVDILSPDPITMYAYPYDILYPQSVMKRFQVDYKLALSLYPEILDPTKGRDNVEYWSFWNNDIKYAEIDERPEGDVKKGLGFCPFVHGYSGFGRRNYDGHPETMAVGKLRRMRATLIEECEIASRIDSILALYANPLFVVQQTAVDADMTGRDELEKTVLGAGQTITVPYGWKSEIYVPDVATAQLFAYYDKVQARLGLDSPSIMSGVPNNSRTTGIQEDIEFGHVFKRYEKLVSNMEEALEATFGRCLQILYETPKALPLTFRATMVDKGSQVIKDEEITKEDIDGYFEVDVKLNPEDNVEDDRDFMKYRMLVNEGRISWKEFLIAGCKMTEWEADETIAEALAEQAVRDDPAMRAARTQEAIERMDMTRYIEKANTEADMQNRMQEELMAYQQQQGQAPQQGYRPPEVQNPLNIQEARQLLSGLANAKGIRNSPQMAVPTGLNAQVPAPPVTPGV